MIEGGGGACFLHKAAARDVVLRNRRAEKLERDKALQPDIARFVDHTHAPLAQLFQDAVSRHNAADHVQLPVSPSNRAVRWCMVWNATTPIKALCSAVSGSASSVSSISRA